MFDDLIDIFSLKDLFEPLTAFFQDLVQGPSVFFRVSAISGYSKREVAHILDGGRVKHWGLLYDGHTIIFSVRQADVYAAHGVLAANNIGVISPKIVQGPLAGKEPDAKRIPV